MPGKARLGNAWKGNNARMAGDGMHLWWIYLDRQALLKVAGGVVAVVVLCLPRHNLKAVCPDMRPYLALTICCLSRHNPKGQLSAQT